jgi:hypothetical protein
MAGCHRQPSRFEPGTVEAVDVQLEEWGQPVAKVSSRDEAKVQALVRVLRTGLSTGDHKCGDSGRLMLHYPNGGTQRIGILAGHDSRYYEFRVYDRSGSDYAMYYVDREPFLKAMAGLGLERLDLGSPD